MKTYLEDFIPKFFGLLRTHEIYPPNNETSIKIRKEFFTVFKEILIEQLTKEIILEVYGNHFLLNNKLMKPESATIILYSRLLYRLNKFGIARIKVTEDLNENEILEFLQYYVEAFQNPQEIENFKKKTFKSIFFWGKETIKDLKEKTYYTILLNFIDTLSKSFVFYTHVYNQMKNGERVDLANLRRITQEFISSIISLKEQALAFLVLGLNENSEIIHCVLRAFLGTLYGLYLNLPLSLLEDLFLINLLTTFGIESVPKEILKKEENLIEEERKIINESYLESYKMLLNIKSITPTFALIINSSLFFSKKFQEENPFFEILKIVRGYEALVQNKPYRLGYHPLKAMEIMWKERDIKYKREYLESFFAFLTKEPIGSCWGDKNNNILVVFQKGKYKKWTGSKWELIEEKPLYPLPFHKVKINPLSAFLENV